MPLAELTFYVWFIRLVTVMFIHFILKVVDKEATSGCAEKYKCMVLSYRTIDRGATGSFPFLENNRNNVSTQMLSDFAMDNFFARIPLAILPFFVWYFSARLGESIHKFVHFTQ